MSLMSQPAVRNEHCTLCAVDLGGPGTCGLLSLNLMEPVYTDIPII